MIEQNFKKHMNNYSYIKTKQMFDKKPYATKKHMNNYSYMKTIDSQLVDSVNYLKINVQILHGSVRII